MQCNIQCLLSITRQTGVTVVCSTHIYIIGDGFAILSMNRYPQYLKSTMYQGHHHHPSTYIIYPHPLFCLSCRWGSFASSNDLVIPVPATGHCSVGHCSSQDEHQPPAQCVAVVQWGQTLHVLAPLLPQPGGTGAGLLETSAPAADGQPSQVHADHGSPGGWVVHIVIVIHLIYNGFRIQQQTTKLLMRHQDIKSGLWWTKLSHEVMKKIQDI